RLKSVDDRRLVTEGCKMTGHIH
ncbi:MAG: hypothetical protein QOF79_1436, partial [Actinomycetota bacterium]|nr:hypothetical protein [Actinomycetota bacterium]